jgi:hypothetical protein
VSRAESLCVSGNGHTLPIAFSVVKDGGKTPYMTLREYFAGVRDGVLGIAALLWVFLYLATLACMVAVVVGAGTLLMNLAISFLTAPIGFKEFDPLGEYLPLAHVLVFGGLAGFVIGGILMFLVVYVKERRGDRED